MITAIGNDRVSLILSTDLRQLENRIILLPSRFTTLSPTNHPFREGSKVLRQGNPFCFHTLSSSLLILELFGQIHLFLDHPQTLLADSVTSLMHLSTACVWHGSFLISISMISRLLIAVVNCSIEILCVRGGSVICFSFINPANNQ